MDFNINREINDLLSTHFGTGGGHRPDPITKVLDSSPLPEGDESPSRFYARQAKATFSDLLVDGADRYALRELMVYFCLSLGLRDDDMWDEVLDTIREVGA
jgi:hypothetical protein